MEGEDRFHGVSAQAAAGREDPESEHHIERQRRAAAARGLDVDEFASFHADDDTDRDQARDQALHDDDE